MRGTPPRRMLAAKGRGPIDGAIVVVLRLIVAILVLASALAAQAGGTAIAIRVDAEDVELIRAWRRAQGLDPPDADADRRVEALLERRRAPRAPPAQAPAHRHGTEGAGVGPGKSKRAAPYPTIPSARERTAARIR
jgi:hypothetical protein